MQTASAAPLSGTADRTFTSTNQPALHRCCRSCSTRRFMSRRRLPSLTCTILLGTHAGRRGNPPHKMDGLADLPARSKATYRPSSSPCSARPPLRHRRHPTPINRPPRLNDGFRLRQVVGQRRCLMSSVLFMTGMMSMTLSLLMTGPCPRV